MLTALRVLWLLSIAAFGGLLVLVWVRSYDFDERDADRYARNLRQVATLDARLDRDVMRTRGGLLPTFDPIVADVKELRALHAKLQTIPRFLSPQAREDVIERLKGSALALDEKDALVDAFKTDDALLKNSTRFFPTGATELGESLRATPAGQAIAGKVDDLARRVLVYDALPDADAEPAIRRSAEALTAVKDWPDDAARADAEILRAHAAVILDHRRVVDAKIEAITKLPTLALAEATEVAYGRQHQKALAEGTRRKLALVLLAIAVVALGAADGFGRMRRTAAAQSELSDRLRKANVALRREQEREKELSDLKSSFVSMASHEFRTPLSVILSSTELLEAYWDRWPAGKKREHFQRIQGAMRTMTRLLDQILVIGRAEAEKLEFAPEPLDVAAFCKDLADAMRQTTGGDRIIELDVSPELGTPSLDERLLRHVLTNLLSNAIKYSGTDSPVSLSAHVDGGELVFRVKDRGIGITERDMPNLFESFHRGENVGDIKGTGLGLAVVARSVDRHGGRIDVTSDIGRGSEFVVTFPLERQESSTEGTGSIGTAATIADDKSTTPAGGANA